MTTDVAIRDPRPAAVALSTDQLQYIAHTEFVPPGLRGNLPAILACVATGREIGIGDMVALKSIHIIDGKATYSAELMVMLARRAGHSITGKVSEGTAKVVGRRADNGDEIEVEWTLAMADRAGLLGKSNWKKYPEAMLWARAVSQLCRELFADCFAGSTYTTEELGDELTDEHAAAVETPEPSPLEGSPPVDMSDPDIPFGDAPAEQLLPPKPSAAQLKKLNVLVGKLRDGENLTTEHLYRALRREPVLSDDGLLHWSPLRDSLSKSEASELIDRLDRYAANVQTTGVS